MRNRSLLAVLGILALLPVTLAWGQANLPNNPNAVTVQGPDPTGMLGYPLATVPATGALPWPISGTITEASDYVDPNNSSTTPLGLPGTFTGAFTDLGEFHGLVIFAKTDQFSTIQIDWSNNGSTVLWSETLGAPPIANGVVTAINTVYRKERYYRVVYTNTGPNPQGNFTLTSLVTKFTCPFPTGQQVDATQGVGIPVGGLMVYDAGARLWKRAATSSGGLTYGSLSTFPVLNVFLDNSRQNIARNIEQGGAGEVVSSVPSYVTDNVSAGNPNLSWARTPNKFNTVATAAAGNTALWTPAAGKKFRLMRYMVTVTDQATQAGAGTLTFTLFDGAAGVTGQVHDVFVPALALVNTGALYSSGWIDLGNGYLSTAANNVLNINLSAALTAGTVRVICCGTEE